MGLLMTHEIPEMQKSNPTSPYSSELSPTLTPDSLFAFYARYPQ